MSRPRFTVRMLMVAVAVVGLGLAFVVCLKRRAEFLEKAENYEYGEAEYLYHARANESVRRIDLAEHLRGRAAERASLARKYRHAARYPWLPVDPDPPE